MNVRFTRNALAQLDKICADIASQTPRATRDFVKWILIEAVRLRNSPESHQKTDMPGVWVLDVRGYSCLMFYGINDAEQEVHILCIRRSVQALDAAKSSKRAR